MGTAPSRRARAKARSRTRQGAPGTSKAAPRLSPVRPPRGMSPMLLDSALSETVVDPRDAAESAGLTYVSGEEPGIHRKKAGTGFTYVRPGGGKVEDDATLNRIRKLAVPPAYTDVWI